uniref:Transmembrane protein 272 n=1 Tax=Taeniopygia guttata TaxID=59729 RepID=A0A674GVN3_TAEGU
MLYIWAPRFPCLTTVHDFYRNEVFGRLPSSATDSLISVGGWRDWQLKGNVSSVMRQLLSKSVVIDDDDDDEYPWRQNAHKYYVHLTLSLFLFLWFILGNYWVFSVYLPNFIPPFHQPQDYCDKTLYIFAVGVLIISHTVLFLLIFCSCCIYCFSRQRFSSEED